MTTEMANGAAPATYRLASSDWDQIVASLEFSLLAVDQYEQHPSPQFRAERRDQIQRVLTKAHAQRAAS